MGNHEYAIADSDHVHGSKNWLEKIHFEWKKRGKEWEVCRQFFIGCLAAQRRRNRGQRSQQQHDVRPHVNQYSLKQTSGASCCIPRLLFTMFLSKMRLTWCTSTLWQIVNIVTIAVNHVSIHLALRSNLDRRRFGWLGITAYWTQEKGRRRRRIMWGSQPRAFFTSSVRRSGKNTQDQSEDQVKHSFQQIVASIRFCLCCCNQTEGATSCTLRN